MPKTYAVSIKPDIEPDFPHRCVACNQPTTRRVTFISRDLRYHVDLRFGWHCLRVPACLKCGLGIHAWRIWYATRTLGSALLLFLWATWILPPVMPDWAAGLVFLALFCLSFVAMEIMDHFFCPAIQVHNSRHRGMIRVEFRDETLATEFRQLNQDHLATSFDSMALDDEDTGER